MTQLPKVEYYAARRTGQHAAGKSDVSVHDPWALLVAHMADGDQNAVRSLHVVWYSELLRIAEMIVRNHADAEEVVNDTFGQAWRDSASFDGARGSSAAWLTTIVRSRARDLVRARVRRYRARDRAELLAAADTTVISIGWSAEQDVVKAVEATELEALLSRALALLPVKQREALELVFLEGMSHTIAAERLGEPLGTVKTRVRLGLRRMRAMLGVAGVTRLAY